MNIRKHIISREFIVLVLIITLAFLVRWFYINRYHPTIIYAPDGRSYISFAENLLAGKGLINTSGGFAILPPMFPLWIAFIYQIFGYSLIAIRMANVFLIIVTLIFIYFTSKKLIKNEWLSYLTVFIATLYPGLISWTAYEITDSFFALACSAVLYFSIVFFEEKINYKKMIGLGALIGISNLIRGNLIFLPFLLVPIFFLQYKIKQAFIAALVFIIAFTIPLCIWGTRNYAVFGEFIPIASHGGTALYYGNNPKAFNDRFHVSSSKDTEASVMAALTKVSPSDQASFLQKKAVKYILNNPRTFVVNTLKRFSLFLRPTYINSTYHYLFKERSLEFDRAITYTFLLGLVAFVYDAFKSKEKLKQLLILSAVFVSISASYSITAVVPSARYRLPVMGIEILVAVYGLEKTFLILSKMKKTPGRSLDKKEEL